MFDDKRVNKYVNEIIKTQEFLSIDEPALAKLAGSLAKNIKDPLVIYFEGDLGAGKTTFCRALIQSMGVQGAVKSPTYTLLEEYDVDAGIKKILHFDLYRLVDAEELEFIGIRDYIDGALWLVEWPERGQGLIPGPDMILRLAYAGDNRSLFIDYYSERSVLLCDGLN